MIGDWLRAFLFTQMLEMGVYSTALGRRRTTSERFAISFGASGITHPALWFIWMPFFVQQTVTGDFETDWWIGVAIGELLILGIESAWLRAFGLPWSRAFAAAYIANTLSFTFGSFCYQVLDW